MRKILIWISFLGGLGSAGALLSAQAKPGGVPAQSNKLEFWRAVWPDWFSGMALANLLLLALGLTLVVYLWRNNRRLRHLTQLNHEAQTSLELAAAAFSSEVGMIIADDGTRIRGANVAMTALLGYTQDDLLGQSTNMLRSTAMVKGTLPPDLARSAHPWPLAG